MALEGVGKPLRLKDLLELECDSCSAAGFRCYPRRRRLKDLLELECDSCSAAGFRCYPRRLCVAGAAAASSSMHHLLEAEALRFGRSPSLRPKLSHLSRSLSRRLKGGFWRRRREEEAAAAAAGPPVAALSSCGCSSDSETSESSNSTERKSHFDFSSASSESLHAGVPAAAGDEYEAMKRESKEAGSSLETDDKEQLSPVAVMDFQFDDDDGGGEDDEDVVEVEERNAGTACSPSFSDSLAQLQRRKMQMQMQHKIRRLGSIGELGPVDLEAHLAASDYDGLGNVAVQTQLHATATPGPNGHLSVNIHEEAGEYNLLELLTDTVPVGVDDVCERLLLDFFVETKLRYECIEFHAPTGRRTQKLNLSRNGEAVRLAKAWLEGTGGWWDLKDVLYRREDFVAEMERSRRWMRVGEEASEVGLVVAGLVIDELVDELVGDLVL